VEAARTVWDPLKGSKLMGRHTKDVFIDQDQGELHQDWYTLHTAPQFLGSFLDLHSTSLSQHTEVAHWMTIKIDIPKQPDILVFAFASRQMWWTR
jgi:hypothetical protein